jgi:hypothetical protein
MERVEDRFDLYQNFVLTVSYSGKNWLHGFLFDELIPDIRNPRSIPPDRP